MTLSAAELDDADTYCAAISGSVERVGASGARAKISARKLCEILVPKRSFG